MFSSACSLDSGNPSTKATMWPICSRSSIRSYLQAQLEDILAALDTELEIFLAPQITAGKRVKIKSGPLRGIEGIVEQRSGMTLVLLRLDFISQAAAVKMEAGELELI